MNPVIDENEVNNINSNLNNNNLKSEKKRPFKNRKVHSSPSKRPRRYSQDSGIILGSNLNDVQINLNSLSLMRHSTENLRYNSIQDIKYFDKRSSNEEVTASSLDDIIESPMQMPTYESTNEVHNFNRKFENVKNIFDKRYFKILMNGIFNGY